ncbi:hypothetical protein [Virgibacillus salidurans]|nr:hypothetical protein [Virgibacillus sp. NKC19-16]
MKQISNKKPILCIIVILFIAGLFDMKYKGLFYRLLQTFRSD